jgi:RIO kinase 2
MKLDATQLRYMSKDEFRLLQTVEMGSRNHEIVPISLICRMTKLRPQTATRQLQALAKIKLVSFEADSKYEGVRLTYGGYDFLALKAFSSRESVVSIGQQIGVGKESDIYLVHGTHHFETVEDIDRADSDESDDEGLVEEIESSVQVSPVEYQERVLKIQRLGRTSFRTVKTNRDYHQHRSSCSWLYLSRLAAGLEYRFMKALKRVGLPVPKPLDWSRHCVVMELIKGTLFENVRLRDGHVNDFKVENSESGPESDADKDSDVIIENRVVDYVEEADLPGLYVRLMELIAELASYGLIHGDFNEFNLLLIRPERVDMNQPRVSPIIIDFPQMVSISHENAEYYFNRDVECIRTFFAKRFHFTNDFGLFEANWDEVVRDEENKLDVELKASGYVKPKRKKKVDKRDCKRVESVDDSELASENESEHGSENDGENDSGACESENY